MFHSLALAAVSALAIATATAPVVVMGPEEIPASLTWQVKPAGTEAAAGSVQFEIGYRSEHHASMTGANVPLATLDGLSPAQLAAGGGPVSFVLHHDAGDFRCHGVAGEGQGVGACDYAANAGFAPALAKRGIGQPEPYQQFQLAMNDIGLDYVDELKREKYATPSVEDLVRAGNHGAGMRQLKAMDAAGYHFGDVATLVRVRDHGVSAKYIEALKGYGYTGLPAESLVKMRDHGVSASYIADLRSHGYSGLNPDDMVHLRDHGVSASYVAELQTIGYDKMPAADLTRLRDHGISTGFIRAASQGGKTLSVDELIRLRNHGDRE